MADSYRVLIVDDDPAQAEMVEEFLRVADYFSVDRAGDIQTLWDRLERGQYDILLLDYKLPDGTGLDALAGIQARGYQLPVVMVTGQGDERVAVQAIQRGATDYLLKSGDYLVTLPALIRKTVRSYQLQISVQRSLEQIRYQATLLNNVRDSIVVWDMQRKITYWNPAAISLFGWSANERLGCDIDSVYLQAFTPPIVVPREGETIGHHVERKCRTKTGQTIWVSSRITALYDVGASNRLIGYMDVSHDITKRKEAEQALRTERNFVSAVLDTVGALVVVLDRQGRIVRFNRTCEQITGYSFTEVRGKPVWELFVQPEDVHQMHQLLEKLEAGRLPIEYENYWITRQGNRRLITWANTALTGRDGQVEFIIATGLDMTERKQAEDALRHRMEVERMIAGVSTDFINLAADQIDDGICQTLKEIGLFVGADCSYVALISENGASFSYTHEWHQEQVALPLVQLPEILVGAIPWCLDKLKNLEQVIVPRTADLPPSAQAEKQWLESRDVRSFAAVPLVYSNTLIGFLGFESLQGEQRWVGEDISLLGMAGETIVNALQRKRMEAQIRAAQTRLTESARLATLGEMASGVAHQINNPLTTIIAETQIMLRTSPSDMIGRDSLEAIEQAGWRLQEVVQRLVEFSRPATATLDDISISQSICRALTLVGAHIETIGVNLVVNLAENLPSLRGNARQLEDLWVNLLLLARDATNDGSAHTIRITTELVDGNSIVVEVHDDGRPIPQEHLASVFEPNFINSPTGRGTGMELSICREIVRQHGGQITAESGPDHDTIFRIIFTLDDELANN